MCDPGTAITVALAVGSTASSLYQAQQQKKAMAYQQQMEQQKLAIQQRQQHQIAEGEALAMRQRITERKRLAAEEYEQNRSTFSGTDIDLDSPSYGAFFAANRKAKKRDIRNIRLMGTERQLNALYGVQQTRIAQDASRQAYKSSRSAVTTNSVANAFGSFASADINWNKIFGAGETESG